MNELDHCEVFTVSGECFWVAPEEFEPLSTLLEEGGTHYVRLKDWIEGYIVINLTDIEAVTMWTSVSFSERLRRHKEISDLEREHTPSEWES